MACNFKHVLSSGAGCKENPAGLSNYMMIVPLNGDYISSIGVHDGAPEYVITPKTGASLKGWKVEFKSQTGQVTSEHNGQGKAWTMTGTGRVEKNETDMAYMSRVLSNMDGKYLCFFPTGNVVSGRGIEWKVVGNQFGDTEFQTNYDSGAARGDDHGHTFTVICNYQLYDVMFWYGSIFDETDLASSVFSDSSDDNIVFVS